LVAMTMVATTMVAMTMVAMTTVAMTTVAMTIVAMTTLIYCSYFTHNCSHTCILTSTTKCNTWYKH